MSQLFESIIGQFSGPIVEQLSGKLGIENQQAKAALGSIVPVLISAMAKNTKSKDGASGLAGALDRDHDGSILNDLMGYVTGAQKGGAGAGILKHVLGGNKSGIERYVSEDSGISSEAAGGLMEMAAPVIMGYLGKQMRQSPAQAPQQQSSPFGNAGSIIDMLQGATNDMGKQEPKSKGVLDQLLDSNNDGSVVDDVAKFGMSFLGKMFRK